MKMLVIGRAGLLDNIINKVNESIKIKDQK